MLAPVTPLLTSFTQADGPPVNILQAINLYSVPPVASNALSWPQFPSAAWVDVFPADQEAWATIASATGTGLALLLRFNGLGTGAETGYAVGCCNNDVVPAAAGIDKWVAGASSNLAFSPGAIPAGYKYGWATAIGGVITGYASPDGITWTQIIQVTDPTFGGQGYIGLFNVNNGTPGTIDDFGGGGLIPSFHRPLPIMKGP